MKGSSSGMGAPGGIVESSTLRHQRVKLLLIHLCDLGMTSKDLKYRVLFLWQVKVVIRVRVPSKDTESRQIMRNAGPPETWVWSEFSDEIISQHRAKFAM